MQSNLVKDAWRVIRTRKMQIITGHIPTVFNSHEIAITIRNMNEIEKTAEALAVVVLDQKKRIEELESKLSSG